MALFHMLRNNFRRTLMINNRPNSWSKDDSLEMLFFFYQMTDELLSETSSDTYALPQHNTLSLLLEMEEIYGIIEKFNLYDEFYQNYIPPIIDEFIESTESDYLLKHILGDRLQSIRTGFMESKSKSILLRRWIDSFKQACHFRRYIEDYRNEIKYLVTKTTDKTKLMYCVKVFYTSLVSLGYAREYLYTTTRRFFDNNSNPITNRDQIEKFIDIFDCTYKHYEFLVLMNTDVIDYIDNLSDNIRINHKIEKVDIQDIRKQAGRNNAMLEIIRSYERLKANETNHKNISIVRYKDEMLDPYSAALDLQNQIRFLQTFTRYFKHYSYSKQIHKFLVRSEEGYYIELKLPNKLQKRPFISQPQIDLRIKNIISSRYMGEEAYYAIAHAIDMHAEAFDSHNIITLFRTFWTALETLFANSSPGKNRDSVIDSVVYVIQKTYILKLLREVYSQISNSIDIDDLKELGINSFYNFVEYFSSFGADSQDMKKIYALLSSNPLLRTRLFSLRKTMNDGNSIKKMLDAHKQRVTWQLKRLYRMRNIATHLGMEVAGLSIVINHLHNYFDYAVNYMLCKSENGDYIVSTSAVVFEAKNDNMMHNEMLKSGDLLSKDNYMSFLFGPDRNLINYNFEQC